LASNHNISRNYEARDQNGMMALRVSVH